MVYIVKENPSFILSKKTIPLDPWVKYGRY